MKLGILINTDRHLAQAVGLARAALAKGHEVLVFVMDAGTRLLPDAAVAALVRLPGVTVTFCHHSAARCGVDTSALPEQIVCGSQLNNAMMNHQADRVIVL